MADLWDLPPFPKNGDKRENTTFAAVGRVMSEWERLEIALAHLFAVFGGKSRFDPEAIKIYGEPANFSDRITPLERAAERYFRRTPNQRDEGDFDNIVKLARGFATRRNDIAHGVVQPIAFAIDPDVTLLEAAPFRFCVVPPHYRGKKLTVKNAPKYALVARQMHVYTRHLFDLGRQTDRLAVRLAYRQHA